jgi:PAS domain S-box-containing protein
MEKLEIEISHREKERINALHEYVALDSLPESDFDEITKLVSFICNVPLALITFVGERTIIFKSHFGTDATETAREGSFCSYALEQDGVFVVPNTREDERFSDNELVTGDFDIQFYAGAPLINDDGYALGTLCVLDHTPRELTENQLEAIKILSHQVIQLIEVRKKNAQLEASKNAYKSLFDQNPDAVFSFDIKGRFVNANAALTQMVEISENELKRTTFARFVAPEYRDEATNTFRKAASGIPQHYYAEIISTSGKRIMASITNIPNIKNNEVIGVFGIAKDITEKHHLQENLSMILSNTRESFMILDRKLNIVFFNESAKHHAEEVLDRAIYRGMNVLEIATPDRIPQLLELYNRVFEGQITQTEIPIEFQDKETVWISNVFSPVVNENGEIYNVIVTTLDITERKKSQLKLEKSELGLKQAQEISNIGSWEIDFLQLKSTWSDEMYRILGLEVGEIEPNLSNFLQSIHPEDAERVTKAYNQQHYSDKPYKSTHRIVRPNGDIRTIYSENKFIVENNRTLGLYGIIRDITEIQESEEQLKSSEQKTRLIMNASLDSIIWIETSGKITFWNPQAEASFGWTKEEALGQNLIDLISPKKDHKLYFRSIQNYLEKDDDSPLNVMVEKTAINKSNEEFPIELTVIPIKQQNEITFSVFIRDISERKRFSTELELSEKRYRNLFYLSPLPMWVYDLTTFEFLDVNDAAVRHYGYTHEEFMSMTLDEIRPDDELGTFEKALNYVKKSVVFHRGDFRHRKKNGQIIDVDVQSNMIDYAGKDARLILAIDITRERENERELKKLTHSLEQNVRERTLELNQANQLLSYEHQQTRDSITYAQNIQSSILHSEADISSLFRDSFVLFKPKDKVTGDFFWCHETEDHYFLAVLDCTGHGVPGAMISMVGFQLLNQIVIINGEISPAEVLRQLDSEVVKLFHQNQEESNLDGMDMIFCRVNKHKREIHYSGAQRPLFYYSDDILHELKGNKSAIGGRTSHYSDKIFDEAKLEYKAGDAIFLTSDGYYSQFGGPKNKIMLKKRMMDEFSKVAHLPSIAQYHHLKTYLETWQGDEEQVDDILVVGVKLK